MTANLYRMRPPSTVCPRRCTAFCLDCFEEMREEIARATERERDREAFDDDAPIEIPDLEDFT